MLLIGSQTSSKPYKTIMRCFKTLSNDFYQVHKYKQESGKTGQQQLTF